jgi:FSR family fosmidomycin resistance protein-like MFS transporter
MLLERRVARISPRAAATVLPVLVAMSYCHFSNDTLQSLLPAIYPDLKAGFGLNFAEIGLVTLVYQLSASLLQPVVGTFADRYAVAYVLPAGTLFGIAGMCTLGIAASYPTLVIGASLLGTASAVFHPEGTRVARMAAGNRPGFAQSLFQVGGNAGSAVGPLLAALVVVRFGRVSLLWFVPFALIATIVLTNVAAWCRREGLARLDASHAARRAGAALPRAHIVRGVTVLLALIACKYLYLISITNYLTFYLNVRFGVSIYDSQLRLFAFAAAVALGTFAGGPLGDRFGRKWIIWFSIVGALPFALLLPNVSLAWTLPVTMAIGMIIASAFPAIIVYAQELMPGRIGTISGLFDGFAFGVGGIGAAILGMLADRIGIVAVYHLCAWFPACGLLAALLPAIGRHRATPLIPPERTYR